MCVYVANRVSTFMTYILGALKQVQSSPYIFVYKSATAVGDFNSCLSVIDRITRQNIFNGINNLNNPVNQVSLTDIYITQIPNTFCFKAHSTFLKIYHIQSHKTSLDKI